MYAGACGIFTVRCQMQAVIHSATHILQSEQRLVFRRRGSIALALHPGHPGFRITTHVVPGPRIAELSGVGGKCESGIRLNVRIIL